MIRVCDWGRTHIAVEGKHKEWRDHRTNLNEAVSRAEVTSEGPASQSVAHPPTRERASRFEFCSVRVPFSFGCAVGVSCVFRHSGPFA